MASIDRVYLALMFMTLMSRVSEDIPWYITVSVGSWIVFGMLKDFYDKNDKGGDTVT